MMFCFLFQKNRHFSLAVTLLRFYYLNCKGGDNRSAVIFDYSGTNNESFLVDNSVYFFLRKAPIL